MPDPDEEEDYTPSTGEPPVNRTGGGSRQAGDGPDAGEGDPPDDDEDDE